MSNNRTRSTDRNASKRDSRFKKGKVKNSDKYSYEGDYGKCNKMKDNDERSSDFNAQKSRSNDPQWYAQNGQLLRDTASLPYSWPLGNGLDLGPYATEINKGSLPGIFAIHTAATFGYSEDPNSPINVAARNIYSYVRHANSGHANYDAVDEMIYLMAMDSCYSFLSYVRRIYGVIATYSYTNRYYPTAICRAMGVDFYDVQEHLADFRAWINTIAVKFGSMCIPASMSYMAKHMWMYEGLYYDSPQDKPQTYLFVPDGFYQFTLDKDGAGALNYVRLQKMDTTYRSVPVNERGDSTLLTFADIVTYGNNLIDPILQSEDMNIMSGDILKAFGSGNLYMLEAIPENYTVLPTYDDEVLDQIQNLNMIGRFTSDTAVLKQSSDKSWLEFTPKFRFPYQFTSVQDQSTGENFLFSSKFLNFDHGNITPEMTMEASRMTQVCNTHDEAKLEWTYKTLASEVAMYGYIYHFAIDPDDGAWKLYRSRTVHTANSAVVDPSTVGGEIDLPVRASADINGQAVFATNQGLAKIRVPQLNPMTVINTFNPMLLLAQQVSQFRRHPAMALTLGIATSGVLRSTGIDVDLVVHAGDHESSLAVEYVNVTNDSTPGGGAIWGKWYGILEDINYYSIVDEKNLINLAQTALLSMFNVTQYGRKSE